MVAVLLIHTLHIRLETCIHQMPQHKSLSCLKSPTQAKPIEEHKRNISHNSICWHNTIARVLFRSLTKHISVRDYKKRPRQKHNDLQKTKQRATSSGRVSQLHFLTKCALVILALVLTLRMAATVSCDACFMSSPSTDRIWSPCISLPSRSDAPPFTTSEMKTPLPFLLKREWEKQKKRTRESYVKCTKN